VHVNRNVLPWASLLPILWVAGNISPAKATEEGSEEDVIDKCVAAYEQAQRHRNHGEMIEAREALMVCSRDHCPDIAKTDCTTWLAEVRRDIPTVVVGARFPDGRDAIDVTVYLDGKPFAMQMDGRPVEVNPGIHTLRFEAEGRPAVEERVSFRVGERNRRVVVTLPDPPAAPPPAQSSLQIPTMSYVLGGVGVLGLVGFGYFGATGLSKESDLDRCKPTCPSNEVDAVRTRYLVGDISLAIGLVALGGASYFYFTKPGDEPSLDTRVGVRLQTGPNHAEAVVGGRF
jgi:hypothetical protein